MNPRTDFTEVPPSVRQTQARTWRVLVGAQVVVIGLIVIALLAVVIIGQIGSIFVQRPL